jgi:ATP-dependent 26S proteasome regulatory subunit
LCSAVRDAQRRSGKRKKLDPDAAAEGVGRTDKDGGVADRAAASRPAARFADLGGLDRVLRELREELELAFFNPELFVRLGVNMPR